MSDGPQHLLSRRFWCFLVVFHACVIFQSMVNTFLSSAVQSFERQFQIPSSKSGLLISASRLGTIPTVLILAYLGNKGNKARWIGCSSLIVAVGCLIAASPNFFYPSRWHGLRQADDKSFKALDIQRILLLNKTRTDQVDKKVDEIVAVVNRIDNDTMILVEPSAAGGSMELMPITNPDESSHSVSDPEYNLNTLDPAEFDEAELLKHAQLPFSYCSRSVARLKSALKDHHCGTKKVQKRQNDLAFYVVLGAVTLLGIGQSVPWTVGTPLIDDSVERKKTPYYFAVLRLVRIMGPLAGMWLAAGCFKLYVTLKEPVGLTPTDPRWIGAWWLGFLIIGLLLTVPSVIFMFFSKKSIPRLSSGDGSAKTEMTSHAEKSKQKLLTTGDNVEKGELIIKKTQHHHNNEDDEPMEKHEGGFCAEAKDFIRTVLQCVRSPIYVSLLIGRIFDSFAWRGLHSFIPKFIENHYGVAQHEVSFFMGIIAVMSFAGGTFAGGFIMKRMNLEGRRAAAYVLVCSVIGIALNFSKATFACQSINNKVGQLASQAEFNLTSKCNQNCDCEISDLYPVCNTQGQHYFSPCHAGCTNFTLNADLSMPTFLNCTCAKGESVSRKLCRNECKFALLLYYAVTVLNGMVAGTSQIPAMLINLRCVPHEVRAVGLAFGIFIVNLISAAPSPIVAGTIIDTACLLWNNVCGRKGACLLYDSTVLRVRLHVISGLLRTAGTVFDVFVWYWAANLVLMEKKSIKNPEGDNDKDQHANHSDNNRTDKIDNTLLK